MRFSETTDEAFRKARLEYIDKRWSDLAELTRDNSAEIARYLFLVNSGSAIATLSFMGAMKTLDPIPGAPTMLVLFVLGIILIGLGRAFATYRSTLVFSNFRRLVDQYYADEITWTDLLAKDATRSKYSVAVDFVAWASFACFVIGMTVAYVDLQKGRFMALQVEKRDQPIPKNPPPPPAPKERK